MGRSELRPISSAIQRHVIQDLTKFTRQVFEKNAEKATKKPTETSHMEVMQAVSRFSVGSCRLIGMIELARMKDPAQHMPRNSG